MSTPIQSNSGLAGHFGVAPFADHGHKWDELWQKSTTPWDPEPTRGPSAALDELLRSGVIDISANNNDKAGSKRTRTALVPACGRGYDVLLLSAWGFDVYGLEISQAALARAKEVQADVEKGTAPGIEAYASRPGTSGNGQVTWILGDFFKDEFLNSTHGNDKFDLIFDYTFFCAIPPSQRPAWAQRMSNLLAEDGQLICLEFPRLKPLSAGGPPHASPSEAYVAHLAHPGKTIKESEDADTLLPTKSGLRRTLHTKPSKTFRIGTAADGSVSDMISVWIHDS